MADTYVDLTNVRGPAARIAGVTAEPADTAGVQMTGPDQNRRFHFDLPRGLPGVNAVAADEATATYVTESDTDTFQAVLARMETYRRTVPAYIAASGAINKEYDAQRRLFNESSGDMVRIRNAVALARQGKQNATIMVFGDSKAWGTGGPVDAALPATIRDTLGASDGIVYAAGALREWADDRWSNVSGFTASSVQFNASGTTGGTSGAKFTFTRPSDGIRIWYYAPNGYTSMTVAVNGGAPVALEPAGSVVPDGSPGWYYADYAGIAGANQSIELSVVSSNGQFQLLGVEALHTARGIRVVNAGLHGSTVAAWQPGTSRYDAFRSSLGIMAKKDGAKIAIFQLGTNVSSGMVAGYQTLAETLRSLGYLLMFTVPGGTPNTGDRLAMKRGIYDIALSLAVPVVDFTDLIGDTVASARGYMRDTLHENATGYRLEAAAVVRALLTV